MMLLILNIVFLFSYSEAILTRTTADPLRCKNLKYLLGYLIEFFVEIVLPLVKTKAKHNSN